jgi:D-xylose transport system substrate-binding protein
MALGACLAIMAQAALLACGGGEPSPPRIRPVIGLSMRDFVEERWIRDRDIFMATADALGFDVILLSGEDDARKQAAQIASLVERGVDALVVVPGDGEGLAEAVAEARAAGIPVLFYERLVPGSGAELYLSFDYVEAGRMQARAVLAALPGGKGRVAIYGGLSDDQNARMAREGISEVFAESIRTGDVVIVDDHVPASDASEEAYAYADALLSRGTRVDAFIAYNDMLAEAIIRALSVHRLAGEVLVAGMDADLSACQRIAEGTQLMTVYKPIEQVAAKGAELARFLAIGERVTVHNAIMSGGERVPFYELAPVAVDRTNLRETVIRDGFHLEADVYRNLLE